MLEQILSQIRLEFPDYRLTPKATSKLMKIINAFLFVLTFGKMKAFMVDYVTTIGDTIYTPSGWDEWNEAQKVVILRHERVHMRQERRMNKYWWAFVYLVPIIPLGFALGRTQLEQEAYEESMRAVLEYYGPKAIMSPEFKIWMTSQFTSSSYGWMAAFSKSSIDKWFDITLNKVLASQVKS